MVGWLGVKGIVALFASALMVIGIVIVRHGHPAGLTLVGVGVGGALVGSVVLAEPAVGIAAMGGVVSLEGARRAELGDRLVGYALLLPGLACALGGFAFLGLT